MAWLWIPAIFLAFQLLLPLIGAIAGYFETRPHWPYGPIEPGPDEPPRLPYHAAAAVEANAMGFRPLVALRDAKGRLYRVRYEFWLSPDRQILAVVGGGTVMNIPIQAVCLYTPLADGRTIVSTNNQAAMDPAPGDPWEWKLLIDADLRSLAAWHHDRVTGSFSTPRPFDDDADRVLGQFAAVRRERVARLLDGGVARGRGDEGAAWSYSALGALRLAYGMHFRGMRDAIVQPVLRVFGVPVRA